ncbi:PEPxxWA-CTERM sorting domain-containing protein [Sphingomonas nostoxanthinifaciens]|uniref:PEPxxWA-CTERM sorting domain-containing protein n=1 Tax=Sphingomonas nostoxanthinifaciens TaxID=2872652 RepID=UPI001CC1CA33|nr:PEPxxWA-CTERM sorting domain-containing protein [Sphingomonas nostoxanthinifaciens]UAK26216.1 PEPxxWA-CTERM sorting domain-containing protein [Sphingomonas nostoxanthinifaciens]
MKVWTYLAGVALLAGASSQADATISLFLQTSGVNNGNVTYVGASNSNLFTYNGNYGAFSIGVSAGGSATGADFFTQTLDTSADLAGSLTIYLVKSGLTAQPASLLSTFTANGYNLVSVAESTFMNDIELANAMFDTTNLGSTYSVSAPSAGTDDSYEVAKYTVTTADGGGTANSTINITAGAVPEAATWAMMLVGFGLMGFMLRQRRPANVTFA